MSVLTLLAGLLMSASAFGFQAFDGGTDRGLFNQINCAEGISCTKGAKNILQMRMVHTAINRPLVAATATTITAAQCGSVFYNTAAVQMELPEASTVLGCTLTFVTLHASNFDINPDDADQILVVTNAAGDAIRNATVGNTITLVAVSASQWVQVAHTGTWTDIN